VIPETGTLPPPPTPEQELKFLRTRAQQLLETAQVTSFHTDQDVLMKIAKLRVLGAWPVPEHSEDDLASVRAYLAGFHEGVRQAIKLRRSGGIA
jgi:hypothetical protein